MNHHECMRRREYRTKFGKRQVVPIRYFLLPMCVSPHIHSSKDGLAIDQIVDLMLGSLEQQRERESITKTKLSFE